MPKRLKNSQKRPADPNQWAHQILQEHLERASEAQEAPEPTRAQISAYMARLGVKGGKISGARRKANLTDKQRRAIAKKAAAARWGRKTAK